MIQKAPFLAAILLSILAVFGFDRSLRAQPAAPTFGSGGLVVAGNFATVDSRSRRLSVNLIVTNRGQETYRLFNAAPMSASDNYGNSWRDTASALYVSGIYICDSGVYCLDRDRAQTERSATLLEPGGSMTIVITLSSNSRADQIGDLVSVGFSPMVQQVRETVGVGGRSLQGSEWHTRSLGAANIPLRQFRSN